MNLKIAILILESIKDRASRSKHTDFDHMKALGIRVIKDVIERTYNVKVGYCSMANINDYDVVLVSIGGPFDAYSLVYTFAKHGLTADDVKPKIVVGGASLINFKTYVEYGDYFVLGRGEKAIIDVIENILDPSHELPNNVFKRGVNTFDEHFYLAQSDELYPYEVDGKRERNMGCQNKCFFCFYTFSRKRYRTDDYILYYHNYKEETFKELEFEEKLTHYTTAIDGYSERLRMAMNKPITDEMIVEKMEQATELSRKLKQIIYLKIFMICALPTETSLERQRFFEFFNTIVKRNSDVRMRVIFTSTPFRAMPLTPAQHSPVDIFTNYRVEFQRYINSDGTVCHAGDFRVYVSHFIDSPLTVLREMVLHRGGVEDAKLVKWLLFNKFARTGKSEDVVRYILKNYPNAEKFYREYEIGDKGEWAYLHTYIPDEALFRAGQRMKERLGIAKEVKVWQESRS